MSSSYEQTPGGLAGTFARLHMQALQIRMAPHKATAAQFPVLQCLWQRDGQTQSDICRSLSVEQPTLANTLSRMVRDKLIRKVKDTNDRRQIIIKLTPRGRELETVLTDSVADVQNAAVANLSPEELDIYTKLTKRMIANLRQDLEQPPMMLDASLAVPEEETLLLTSPLTEPEPADEDVLILGDEYAVER